MFAVGQDEEALATVGSADLGCAVHTPARIEPERGQRTQDLGESVAAVDAEESRDILEKDSCWGHVSHDSGDVRPDPARVSHAAASAGDRGGLAGESRHHEIHRPAPSSAVEAEQVVPDRSRIQPPVRHARDQRGGGIGFPLDVSDGVVAVAEGDPAGEFESADAGAEGEASEGRGR